MMFFDNIGQAIEDIQAIQHDELNPNDCAKKPHDVTHTVDGIRYFAITRQVVSEVPEVKRIRDPFFEEDEDEPAEPESYLIGGEITEAYIGYA